MAKENMLPDIKKFFSTPEKPVSMGEMSQFWKSLTPEQKDYYKQVDLG